MIDIAIAKNNEKAFLKVAEKTENKRYIFHRKERITINSKGKRKGKTLFRKNKY